MDSTTYIGFEGPIGAGKTTLSRLLADSLRATLIIEDVDGNEFLPDFYENRNQWAIPMQLWFLAARHRQLTSKLPSTKPIVADYTFYKDAVFAGMLLRDRGLRLYDYINSELAAGLVYPSLIVYLDANNDILMERIKKRGREYEDPITPRYEDQIRGAYENFFARHRDLNLIRFNTSSLDIESSTQTNQLFKAILDAAQPKGG